MGSSFEEMKSEFRILVGTINDALPTLVKRLDLLERASYDFSTMFNNLEQKFLNAKMDIHGLETKNGIDVRVTVFEYIESLGIAISRHELLDAYEFTWKRQHKEQRVIRVTFAHERVKSRIIREKIQRSKREETIIFFNDVLTSTNRKILMEGKRLQKETAIRDIKFLHGNIFVFRDATWNKILVKSVTELFDVANGKNNNEDNLGSSDGSEGENSSPVSSATFKPTRSTQDTSGNSPHTSQSLQPKSPKLNKPKKKSPRGNGRKHHRKRS